MTTADWAIVISIGSFVLSLAGFIWSVWSKFIYPKPKVQVSIDVVQTFGNGEAKSHEAVSLQATNYGPAAVTLHSAIARSKRKWYKRRADLMGVLNPYISFPEVLDSGGPFSGGLPKKIEVGEQFSAYFPVANDWFEKGKFVDIGFCDTFGRNHWSPRKSVKQVRETVLERT